VAETWLRGGRHVLWVGLRCLEVASKFLELASGVLKWPQVFNLRNTPWGSIVQVENLHPLLKTDTHV
jgi:hypothetical protein